MFVGVRRSEFNIIRDILELRKGKVTVIRSIVNLSHAQMSKYLNFLENAELIEVEKHGSRTLTFEVTKKGYEALVQIDKVFELIGVDS